MLNIKQIKASYFTPRGVVQAVDDVSMTIMDNEILGIAGESGCGKSTLVKIVYGFIEPPLRLTSGTVEAVRSDERGQSVTMDHAAIRKAWWQYISYIPQGSMSVLNPVTRIESQFLDAVGVSTKSKTEIRETIRRYLRELDLPADVLKAYPHQLSGGMRQRVIVALATFLNPQVILADEPTTALDVVVQRGIITMLSQLQERMHNSLVIVSHDMGVHYQIANRMAIMYAGKLVELGPVETIFGRPEHPYTDLLIGALPKIGDHGLRQGIAGAPPSLLNPPAGCRFWPRCPRCMDVCKTAVPPLQEREPGHFAACHLYTQSATLN
jgi:peptide/nickel transport system ATP-binding protein